MAGIVRIPRVMNRKACGVFTASQTAGAGAARVVERSTMVISP
jgi:hypothetical protein